MPTTQRDDTDHGIDFPDDPDERTPEQEVLALAASDQVSLPPVDYRGYRLVRVEDGLNEYFVFNRTGNHVETVTIGCKSCRPPQEFLDWLDELIDENPATMSAWLNS